MNKGQELDSSIKLLVSDPEINVTPESGDLDRVGTKK